MDYWAFLDELCDDCRIDAELFKDWAAAEGCEHPVRPEGRRDPRLVLVGGRDGRDPLAPPPLLFAAFLRRRRVAS